MPTSIFTDDTGRRGRRARWTARLVSATLVVGMAVSALSLFTNVSLPSLDLPNTLPGRSDTSAQEPKQPRTAPSPAPGESTSGSTNPAVTTPKNPDAVVTPVPTPTVHSKASEAPRATPTHGTRPETPPGKSK